MPLAIELPDEAATSHLAIGLARLVRRGDVIGLSGPLGSGKTTFARAFICARLGIAEVPSPTFALVEVYESTTDAAIWHFDLYRMEKPDDVYELGFEDALADGILLIEWPERLGGLMPREHLGLILSAGEVDSARHASLAASPAWASRIAGLLHD